jgi:hypothetical protein
MKAFIAATCLILPAMMIPAAVSAQQEGAQQTTVAAPIVVTAKYMKDWTKGSKMEAEGLKDLEKAKNNLVGYAADVVEAQNKRDSSQARGDNASAEFRRLTANPIYFADGEEAARWAKQVDKAASEWAKFAERGTDGRDDLDSAMSKQNKAQAAVDKAQNKVDRGRTMKIEAERLSGPSVRR